MPEVLFVGREREQDVYKKFLARETPWVLIITGLGGIGKTTLLHRLAEYTSSESTLFKTGVVTLDFANEELRNDPLKLLDKLTMDTAPYCDLQQVDSEFKIVLQQNFDQLAQLSIERAQTGVSESEDPALREIRHQMRELATEAFYTQIKTLSLNRLVIMLDTCEWLTEPEGIEVGQWVLNELVPGLHTRIRQQGRLCHVVMSSRVQLKLDAINGRDQQRLTLPMLGKAEVDQYLEHMGMQDADLRQRVFEVTHGLALCVSIIGDFWQQREAQKEPFTIADLPELQIQEFSEIALMQFTNERVLKQLKSPFKELTRYGVLLRSFDLPLLRNVFLELLPEAEALDRFNQLIRYPYIESRGNYRYAFHELLREALSEVPQREEPDEWKCYHKLALDYLTKVSPHSPDRYYHLLAYDEKQGLVEWQQAIQEARERGKREFTGALLQAALDEALHLSPAAQAEVSYEQGRFNFYGVQWEEALKSYNEALAFFQQVEDNSGKAKVLQAMGDIQRALGKLDAAMMSYEQAFGLFQLVEDHPGEAKCSQAMGDINSDLDDALLCYEHCLLVFRQLKDRSEEAKALESIGDVHRLRNNLDEALHCYEQALALYQEEKDRLKRAKVLKGMGDVQRLLRDENAALESYGQALALFGELKEPIEEAYVRRAVDEMEQEKDRLKRAKVLKAMGDVHRLRQERNAALESYWQALALFGELKEPAEEANVRRAMDEMEQTQSRQGMLLETDEYVDQTDRSSAVSELSQPVQQRPAKEALMMAKKAGQRLGNYRLVRLLGQGGFADVYLGEHVFLGTKAAIKVLQVRLTEEEMEAFLNEARLMVELTHPNILRVLEFGVEENVPFLVMEYAPNGTLRMRHPRGTILPLPVVVSYVKQIASALQYVHDRKLIHRDIKPENLLLGSNNEVLLSDFGTAMVFQTLHDQGTLEMAGTVTYIAPEQIRGKFLPASDQYGLGVVVYEWLCGTCPFHGSFIEVYSQQMLAGPPSLRSRVSTIPPEVEQVVMTALAKEPEQRFASVWAFANALEQASKPEQRMISSPSTVGSPLPAPSSNVYSSSRTFSTEGEGLPTVNASVSERVSRSVIIPPHSATSSNTPVTPQPVITPGPVVPRPNEPPRRFSRRAVVVGLLGLASVAAAGGAAWLRVSKQNPFVFPSNPTPTPVSGTTYVPRSSSPMLGFNPLHTHYNPDENILSVTNVSGLTPYWTATTGGLIKSSPVVANRVVFISSTDHNLYAFDATMGQKLWTALDTTAPSDRGSFIFSTPAVVNGVVYIGSTDHDLYAFNATTGKRLWTAPTGGAIFSSPTVVNGVVYIGSDDYKLYAFDATTGKSLWAASTGGNIVSSPAMSNGVVYIGSDDHKLYAFNAHTGSTLWTAPTAGKISSTPAVVNGVVYVGSEDGNLYVYNALGCGQGQTVCPPLWIAPTGSFINSSPAVANDIVYIGSHDKKLYAFKASGCGNRLCTPLWAASTGGPIESSPAVANGVVYIGSNDGNLYAFDANRGITLWIFRTGGRITASPTVVNGVVYVGSDDHKLYAFHLQGAS